MNLNGHCWHLKGFSPYDLLASYLNFFWFEFEWHSYRWKENLSLLNIHSFFIHFYIFSLFETFFICIRYELEPVCVRLCFVKFEFVMPEYKHLSHLYGFSPLFFKFSIRILFLF